MEAVDTLLHARWIVPVEPQGLVLENHSLAIKDGRIHDILPAEDAKQRYSAQHTQHLAQHMLIPGFINAHTHAAMQQAGIDVLRPEAQTGESKPTVSVLVAISGNGDIWIDKKRVEPAAVRASTPAIAAGRSRGACVSKE